MNTIDKYIEWVVAVAVILITTFPVFESSVKLFAPATGKFFTAFHFLVLILLLSYQYNHYKWKDLNNLFILFVIVYNIYILLYTTLLRVYPLENLLGLPSKMNGIYIKMVQLFGYLACAETIYRHFNVRKFFCLSILFCTTSTIAYINFVGVSFFQNAEWLDEEGFIHPLKLSYSNVPILVIAILNYNKLVDAKWLSYIICGLTFVAISYIFIAVTKRGPILWTFVNIAICFYLIEKKTIKYMIALLFVVLLIYYNFDAILDWLYKVAPSTANRIYRSVYEGETAARFNLNDQQNSNYILGFNQFLTSPIYGSYFRLITNNLSFRGVYPHIIYVEMLMTMGLVGFVPFMMFLKRSIVNLYRYTIKISNNQVGCIVLFLAGFLQLHTTGTCVLNIQFWLFFYIVYKMNDWNKLAFLVKKLKKYIVGNDYEISISNHNNP